MKKNKDESTWNLKILKSRSAQIRMTETIAVLFIFFVLILFGVIFYYKYHQGAMEKKAEELLAKRAMETTLKTLFMPELMCTKGEAEPESNCFDVLKLNSMNNTFEKYDNYYYEIFSYGRIYVQMLYPEEETWLLYDKPRIDEAGNLLFTKEEPTYFVVTLRDETKGDGQPQYGYGYVAVVVYQ